MAAFLCFETLSSFLSNEYLNVTVKTTAKKDIRKCRYGTWSNIEMQIYVMASRPFLVSLVFKHLLQLNVPPQATAQDRLSSMTKEVKCPLFATNGKCINWVVFRLARTIFHCTWLCIYKQLVRKFQMLMSKRCCSPFIVKMKPNCCFKLPPPKSFYCSKYYKSSFLWYF